MAQKPSVKKAVSAKRKAALTRELQAHEDKLAAESLPWDRVANETDPAFAAFKVYRDLGHERSHAEVVKRTGKSLRMIYMWSSKYRWKKRVEAYDQHLDRVEQREAAEAVQRMRKRHADLAVLMLSKAVKRLAKMDPDTLQDSTLLKFIELGAKIESRARGEPEEIHQLSHTSPPAKPVQTITIGGQKIEF